MRYTFLAIVSFFFLTPATAVAQYVQPPPQIAVPQCPSDADCRFHAEGHVFEQYSTHGGGGYYPPPYYGGGWQSHSGGRAQNNFTIVIGVGGQGRSGGGQGQLRCNSGDQIVNGQCYHQGGRITGVTCQYGGTPVERAPGYWECVR